MDIGNSFESFLVAVEHWAEANDISGDFNTICEDPRAKKFILEELIKTGEENKLKGFELIKAVHLDPTPFDMERDLLTPTYKKKRANFSKYYQAMNREYTAGEFRKVADTLIELIPGMQIATDIICGYPGETDEDFEERVNLIKEYKFSQVHVSQFYPRPGTSAARMKKVPSNVVKKRSRELTTVFESFTPYVGMEGRIERIWINDIATDNSHLVGHTKGYIQVLVQGPENLLGTTAMMKITSVGRWSVFGEIIEILTENVTSPKTRSSNYTKCSDSTETCCSNTEESCACELSSSCGTTEQKPMSPSKGDQNPTDSLLQKRKTSSVQKKENEIIDKELDEK